MNKSLWISSLNPFSKLKTNVCGKHEKKFLNKSGK